MLLLYGRLSISSLTLPGRSDPGAVEAEELPPKLCPARLALELVAVVEPACGLAALLRLAQRLRDG